MRAKLIFFLFLSIVIFDGCKKDEGNAVPDAALYNFSFLKLNNPGLAEDVKLTNYGQKITGVLPYTADITNLVATFDYSGISITVNNEPQQSGSSKNDFTQIVNYTITSEDGSVKVFEIDAAWFTGLPMFYIYTDNEDEIDSKEEYRSGNAIIKGGRLFDDNSGEMEIRGRGHSTWYFHPKKPYQLKFDDKTGVLGMPADKKWIFLSEHSDKTLIRNKLAFEMGYLSNLDWTPQSVYAEVFVNDDYRGTYTIAQKIEESQNRVDIGESGFLLEIDTPDHVNPDDVYFNSTKFFIQIKEPSTDYESDEFNYIKNYIIEFENVLFSDNFADPINGYKKYIDVGSFADWYLINEIAKNQDARDYSSIFLNLVPGEKLKMGPIWDFDLGFGNVNYSDCEFATNFWVKYHAWIERLFQDPEFVAIVKSRFVFYKNNEAYLLQFIDKTAANLNLAQAENNKRWEVFGNWIWPNPVVFNSHQEEVDYLKDWFTRRMAWLDKEYKSM